MVASHLKVVPRFEIFYDISVELILSSINKRVGILIALSGYGNKISCAKNPSSGKIDFV
jgi:hypothetical protein